MKKALSLFLALLMLLSLCACEKDDIKATDPTAEPTVAPVETPTDAPTEAPTAAPTQAPTAVATEKVSDPTQVPTQAPTQKPTQAPTQKPTQAPTQKPTQAPTQKPTQAPTQKPTQAPTQKPTQAPTEPPYTTYSISKLPQKSKDIAPATIKTFNGNIKKENQVDVYTYTAVRDGRYTFKLSEMRAENWVSVYILDRLGEVIEKKDYQGNGDYICLELEAGETYTCKIYQNEGLGNYILNICEQTPTTDISAYSAANDSVTFEKQRNQYTFIPARDGRYTFYLSEMKADIWVSVYILDRLGEVIEKKDYQGNGDYIWVDLKAGEAYTCTIYQSEGLGKYTLNVGKQKETTDIVVRSIVEDSLEFDRQINLYTFTATAETHTLTFSEMKNDITMKVYVENHLEETVAQKTYCENGSTVKMTKLKPGKQYTIRVCQDDGYYDNYGNYTFTLE